MLKQIVENEQPKSTEGIEESKSSVLDEQIKILSNNNQRLELLLKRLNKICQDLTDYNNPKIEDLDNISEAESDAKLYFLINNNISFAQNLDILYDLINVLEENI